MACVLVKRSQHRVGFLQEYEMTYTTFAILIYGFVLVMYGLGTWATWRAQDAVRKDENQ